MPEFKIGLQLVVGLGPTFFSKDKVRYVEESANDEVQARRKAFDHYPGYAIVSIEEKDNPNTLTPDEWVTVYAALRSRAHSLREMAGEPQGLSMDTRKKWADEASRLDAIVQKLATAMGQH